MIAEELIEHFLEIAKPEDDPLQWAEAIQQISPDAFERIIFISETIHDPRFTEFTDERLGTHRIAQEALRLVPVNISRDDFFRVVEFFVEREKALEVLGINTTESGSNAE